MKRSKAIAIVLAISLLSAFSGYAGSMLANQVLINNTISIFEDSHTPNSQLEFAYLDFNLSERTALSIPEIAQLNKDSVVEISTEIVQWGSIVGQYISKGAGSGVILTADGYIVTNAHVIDNAHRITVRLDNGLEHEATLLGSDMLSDIAVLKIDAENLSPVNIGNSANLTVGDLAVVIGSPLGRLGGTVTEGIISALDRQIEVEGQEMTLLQTSAAINPGNSGGGIFNKHGELVGIVNAKTSGSGIEGLGFAIPINSVISIIDDLIEFGYVIGRVDLGFTMIDVLDRRLAWLYNLNSTGVYVLQVHADVDLLPGDRIITFNGTQVFTSENINKLVEELEVGDIVIFEVKRGDKRVKVEIQVSQKVS